jgi:hypothetical protein
LSESVATSVPRCLFLTSFIFCLCLFLSCVRGSFIKFPFIFTFFFVSFQTLLSLFYLYLSMYVFSLSLSLYLSCLYLLSPSPPLTFIQPCVLALDVTNAMLILRLFTVPLSVTFCSYLQLGLCDLKTNPHSCLVGHYVYETLSFQTFPCVSVLL